MASAEDCPVTNSLSSSLLALFTVPQHLPSKVSGMSALTAASGRMTEEHRHDRRERVLRRAVLIDDHDSSTTSCLILDLSASGARVQLLGGGPRKGPLTLIDTRAGDIYEATLVWSSGDLLGLAFTSVVRPPPSFAPAPRREAIRALVVDDDPTNRLVLEKVLHRLGAQVSFAVDGASAVTAVESDAFDVVLMDLRMPGMDGYEAISRIRATEANRGAPSLPIIVVSAHTASEEVLRAKNAGANDHIAKPVNGADLLDRVRRLTARAESAAFA